MSPKYINTQAIVIKRSNYKEADKLITLFTKDNGKIAARAKGVRNLKSKNRSNLELFNHLKVYLVEGHVWYIITQTELLDPNSSLKTDLSGTNNAFFISEILDKLIPEEENSDELFDFILKTFKYLDHIDTLNFINAFCVKLLKMTGYYNENIFKSGNMSIKPYLDKLLRSTYEEILNTKTDRITEVSAHKYLRSLIEEITEKEIRTNIIEK